jgi:alkylhydroperoxidase family enzyme
MPVLAPRLAPLDRPPSLLVRLIYRATQRAVGAVIGPAKVLYARKPRLAVLTRHLEWTAESLSLEPALRLLVRANAARLHGCAFCYDLKLAQALQAGIGTGRFAALADFRTSDLFSERERAALAYCTEALERYAVSDATFAALRQHFSEEEIVELTWLNAAEAYHNLQTGPLRIPSDGLAARAASGATARA